MAAEDPEQITRKDLALMRAMVAANKTLPEIADETGWSRERIGDVQAKMFREDEPLVAGQRSEEIYMAYVLETRRNIKDLREILEELRGSNQGSAAVGAVSAAQRLLDSIVKTGQTLGFISREPVRHEHAHLIANMDDLALAKYVQGQIEELQGEIKSYGGTAILEQKVERRPAVSHDFEMPKPRPGVDRALGARKIARMIAKRRAR